MSPAKYMLFYVPLAYSIPCCAFYIFTIYVLSTRKLQTFFNSSFFTLFKLQGVIDLIVQLSAWLTLRVPFSGLFDDVLGLPYVINGWIPTMFIFVNYYSTHAQLLNLALITLNRLVVIACSRSFQSQWTRFLKVFIVIVLLLPALLTWQIIAGGAFFRRFPDEGFAIQHNKFLGIRNSLYVLIVVLTVSAFSFLVNLTTVVFILAKKSSRKNWVEVKLFFLTLAMLLVHLLQAALQLVAFSKSDCLPCLKDVFTISPFVADLTCLSSPFFLLITSRTFRKSVGKLMSWSKTQVSDSSLFAKRS